MTNRATTSSGEADIGSEAETKAAPAVSGTIKWMAENANHVSSIIAVTALLVSGVVWVSNYFATQKQLQLVNRQLRIADCRSIRFVGLARAEVEAKIAGDEAYRRTVWVRTAEEKRAHGEQTYGLDQIEKWKLEEKTYVKKFNTASDKARNLRDVLDGKTCEKEIKL